MMEKKNSRRKQVQLLPNLKVVDTKYTIKNHLLGRGAFSQTYIALEDNRQQILACKMISKMDLLTRIKSTKNKTLTKQYLLNALKNQVLTWKTLNHKNIVKFYDFSETSNNIYLFLQYCQEGNLEVVLKNGKLNQKQAMNFFKQLTDACQYLYDMGIFHRDLKTQNILLHKGVIKVADFGFAKVFQKQAKDSSKVRTSVGTPIYMAPQVLLGEPYNIKCDVWSMGVVLYRILYGMFPWEQTQNYEALKQHILAGYTFPPSIKISEQLKKLISQMLVVDQNQRIGIKGVKAKLDKISSKMQIQ